MGRILILNTNNGVKKLAVRCETWREAASCKTLDCYGTTGELQIQCGDSDLYRELT